MNALYSDFFETKMYDALSTRSLASWWYFEGNPMLVQPLYSVLLRLQLGKLHLLLSRAHNVNRSMSPDGLLFLQIHFPTLRHTLIR